MYRRMSCLYAILIMLFVLAIPVGKMAEGATNPAPIDPSQASAAAYQLNLPWVVTIDR